MFDHGNVSFKVCRLPEDMPEDAIERFAANCAGPLENVADEPQWGWVTCRHLLDTDITEEKGHVGSFYHICLRQAVRRIPASLLNAEARLEELGQLAATGADHLNNKQRKEIKQQVKERLLPQMPPQLTGIYCVVDQGEHLLYTSAVSNHAMDIFIGMFGKAMGFEPIPLTPDYLCEASYHTDPASIPAVCISPVLNYDDGEGNGTLGGNFLTWLWYYLDSCGGNLPPSKLGSFGMMLDGPLTFVSEGGGAYESAVKKGTPTASAEAKAALMVGKKLKSARLLLAQEKMEWSCAVDADEFAFKGMKLPEGEAMDPESVFEERMNAIYTFFAVFNGLFEKYLNEMSASEKLGQYRTKAREWVQGREER